MAKRKRINVKFIVICAIGLVCLAGIALVLKRTVFRPNPDKYFALAKESIAKEDWDSSIKNLGTVIRYARAPDPTIWYMLADAYRHLTARDFADNNRQYLMALDRALQVDPQYLPAQKEMMEYQMELVQLMGIRRAEQYEALAKQAEKTLALDAKDARAQYIALYATLDKRINGIQVDSKKLDEAAKKMAEMLAADPNNADAAFSLGRWRVFRIWEEDRQGNSKQARTLFDELDKDVAKWGDAKKENPIMHLRLAQLLLVMADTYPALIDRNATSQARDPAGARGMADSPMMAAIRVKRGEYRKRAFDHLDAGAKLIKPTDPQYIELLSFYAQQLERPLGLLDFNMERADLEKTIKDANEKAEKIYREILKNDPGEGIVRLKLAEFLVRNYGRRDEAIEILLQQPKQPSKTWIGVKGYYGQRFEVESAISIANMRLDLVDFKTNKADRDSLIKQAQTDFDAFIAKEGESSWQSQQIKGRLQLLAGHPVEANASFERAQQNFRGDVDDLSNLKYLQARTFLVTNQTGEARQLLQQVVAASPGNFLARAQLTELLINEGNIKGTPPSYSDGAIAQVDALEKLFSADHPVLIKLRLRTLDREKDKERFTKLWASVPEKTVEERLDKSRFAASMNYREESIRLLELIRADRPDILDILQPLIQMYLERGEKDKAVAVIDSTIKNNPKNQALIDSLNNAKTSILDPGAAMAARETEIKKITDPLRRESAWIDYYRDQGDQAKLQEHVLEAYKLAPENPGINVAMFEVALTKKDWDEANKFLEKIVKRNLDNLDGQTFKVRMALAQGNFDQAQELALQLTKTQGAFGRSWVLLGQTYQARSKFEEAIAPYNEAIKRQPQNLDALRGLIECSYALNRPGKASDIARGQEATGAKLYIEKALKSYPFSAQFKELGLRWEMNYGNPDSVIAPRAQTVKDHPESPGAWYDLAMAYYAAAEPRRDASVKTPTSLDESNLDANSRKYFQQARDTLADAGKKFPDDNRFMPPLINVLIRLKELDSAEKALTGYLDRPEFKGKPEATTAMADFYVRVKQPEKAEKVLRGAIAADPKNETLEVRLANILQSQGRIDEALKVLESNDTSHFVLRQRLNLMISSLRVEDANKLVNDLLAKDPNNTFYIRLRVNVDLVMGKLEETRAGVAKLLAADPKDIDGLFLRARANLMDPRGDVGSAISDLLNVVNMQPNNGEARDFLAEAYTRRRLVNDAILVLQGSLQIDANDKPTRLKLLSLYQAVNPPRWFDAENLLKDSHSNTMFMDDPDFAHAEAQMWIARKDPAKAMDLMKQVISKAPDNLNYARTYLSVLAENKDYKLLLSESERIIKLNSKTGWALYYRALAKSLGQNDRKGALADYKTALDLSLAYRDQAGAELIVRTINTGIGHNEAKAVLAGLQGLDAHWQLFVASMLAQIGEPGESLATIEKVLTTPNLNKSDRMDALKIGGAMYMNSSSPNTPKAIEFYTRLIQESPDDFEALNNVAYLLLEPGPARNPADSLKYAEHVLNLTRKQNASEALPLVMDTYAWALINNNRLDEGVSTLKEALAKQKFPEAYYHLGYAYEKYAPPKLLEAERALLDARQTADQDRREGRNVDKQLLSNIEQELERVKSMKK